MNDLDLNLDLSSLGAGFSALQASGETPATISTGAALEILLDDIIEDADQVRRRMDPVKLEELAETIKARGVDTPISVKSRNADGKHEINYGHRRYRASRLAGKTTIPAFISDTQDDYSQAIENIQREDLEALDIAHFIKKRRAAGDIDKHIGERLGKSKSFISTHAALLNWPPYIEALYEAGHCKDASTLYNLIQLDKKAPKDVEAFCLRNEPVARRDVIALQKAVELANEKPLAPSSSSKQSEEQGRADQPGTGQGEAAKPQENTKNKSNSQRPTIMVTIEGRVGRLLLERKASPGNGWVNYNGTTDEQEVVLSAMRITSIVEQGA